MDTDADLITRPAISRSSLEETLEMLGDESFRIPGYDDAIIGVTKIVDRDGTTSTRLVYCGDAMIEICERVEGEDYDSARDFVECQEDSAIPGGPIIVWLP